MIAHLAAQDYLVTRSLHLDLRSIQHRATLERGPDGCCHVRLGWSGCDRDQVDYALHPGNRHNSVLSVGHLIAPLDLAFQGNPALADRYPNRSGWNRAVRPDPLCRRRGDLPVCAALGLWKLDLDVVGNCSHP